MAHQNKSHNIFNNLEEIVDHDDSTSNIERKAKKKLREIELLKARLNITPEQQAKIKLERHWKLFIKSNIKLYSQNKFGVTHSFRLCHVNEQEECPICLNLIHKNLYVTTNCNHVFCGDCIHTQVASAKLIRCSLCRQNITNLDFHEKDNMHEVMRTLAFKKVRLFMLSDDY
uniref:RING-type domain-containing protein n=1 Tax=viral metagenome TaxID=1070528 RepID=A0A6C0JK19_9ZZZZ